jgi:hypothetical protein
MIDLLTRVKKSFLPSNQAVWEKAEFFLHTLEAKSVDHFATYKQEVVYLVTSNILIMRFNFGPGAKR